MSAGLSQMPESKATLDGGAKAIFGPDWPVELISWGSGALETASEETPECVY